jgi:hypothetical protein
MYEVPQQDQKPGCRDAWVITLAMFSVILPVMLALLGLLGAVTFAFVLFTIHPALALIPLGVMALAVWAFARWDQSRSKPPGL